MFFLGTIILVDGSGWCTAFLKVSTSAVTDTLLSVSVLTDTAVNSSTVNHSEKQVVSVRRRRKYHFSQQVFLQLIFLKMLKPLR